MQESITINCPVSAERINENAARTAAFFVMLIAAFGVWFNSYILIILLSIDFALRAFTKGNASPIKLLAKQTVQLLHIKNKPVDAAPKKFAAGMGMVFCLIIAVLLFTAYTAAAYIITALLLLCALLEGAAGICVGCIVYTFAVLPFIKKDILTEVKK